MQLEYLYLLSVTALPTKSVKYKFVLLGLAIFIIADIGFTFLQFYNRPLDGDMPGGVVPEPDVAKILSDPLGFKTLSEQDYHANPNKYFSHAAFFYFFRLTPGLVQKFTDPVTSLYLSAAIFKIFTHSALLLLIAIISVPPANTKAAGLIMALSLCTPLFQSNGYQAYMGLVDHSVTYTFFYGFPFALLLLLMTPVIREFLWNRPCYSKIHSMIAWPLAVIVPLSGPLNPGIIITLFILIVLDYIIKSVKHQNNNTIQLVRKYPYLILALLASIYSLLLGSYNSISLSNKVPLQDLYNRLPTGIYYQLSQKLGLPLLILGLLTNVILLRRAEKKQQYSLLSAARWSTLFITIYIVLLPLGGFREYRPNILRYDTFAPATSIMIVLFCGTTTALLQTYTSRIKKVYGACLFSFLLIFMNADKGDFSENDCEEKVLREISRSDKDTIKIPENCLVLSWKAIDAPTDSRLISEALILWNITTTRKVILNQQVNESSPH